MPFVCYKRSRITFPALAANEGLFTQPRPRRVRKFKIAQEWCTHASLSLPYDSLLYSCVCEGNEEEEEEEEETLFVNGMHNNIA